VNRQIVRLYGLVVVLFGILVVATSWWSVLGAKGLEKNPANRRSLLEEARVKRGLIRARNGEILARSIPESGGTFRRVYPKHDFAAQTVGYSFIDLGRSGTELFRNDELGGKRTTFGSLLDQLRGKRREGNDVVTNIDPKAQQAAVDALAGRRGAVVVMEPATGKVRVMVSLPQYDLNLARKNFSQLTRQEGSPLLNRVTQAAYPPGSTFKVVTAIAALDSGKFTPDSTLSGKSPITISGVPLRNDAGEQFGDINFTTALTLSVNTFFAQVGEALGKKTMGEYMTRLGFYSKLPLDYPRSQIATSGEFTGGRKLDPESSLIDVGRMAIGQDKLQVTPLQMAMVASAVANGGVLVEPRIADRVVDKDGRVVEQVKGGERRVMKKSTAAAITQMMAQVVKEGTGTAGALSGIAVAGKTGTAEIDVNNGVTQPWFIAFAPVDHPRYAIAATVERDPNGGFGGTVAAPIAKAVLETLLSER